MRDFFWCLTCILMLVSYLVSHEIEKVEKVEPRLLRSVGFEINLPRQRGSVAQSIARAAIALRFCFLLAFGKLRCN